MEDDPSTGYDGISRRAVLRTGTAVATGSTFGLATLTGTVTATRFCPRSPEYWMNHWHEKFGDSVTMPPAGSLTKNEVQNLLKGPMKGDKVNIMAKQYVATYLNLLLRPDPDEPCANKAVAVDGIGTVEWEHVKNSAQHWLRLNGWDGTKHSGKQDWTPTMSVEGAAGEVNGEILKDALDAFNNSEFSELDCNCGDGEEGEENEEGDEKKEEEGINVHLEDCKTVHVRGSERDLNYVEVTAWEAGIVDPDEVTPSLWTTFDDLPHTVDFPGEPGEPSAATLKEITVYRFEADNFSVTPPDEWGCRELVEQYVEE